MANAVTGVAVMVLTIGACATPYQRKGFSGGYSDTQLGAGRYAIDVQVNSFTSRGTALEYAHRRAGELCPEGYETVDGSQGQSDFYMRNGNTVQNMPKANIGLIVECNEPEPPPRIAADSDARSTPSMTKAVLSEADPGRRRVIEGTRSMWCARSVADDMRGICFPDEESDCTAARDAFNLTASATAQLKECAQTAATSCFNYTIVLTDERGISCGPSISSCEETLTRYRTNPDYTVTASHCGIYRTKGNK